MRKLVVIAAIASGLWWSPSAANADEVSLSKTMRFIEQGDDLLVSTSITEAFDQAAYERLASGFPTTVLVRFYLYRDGGEEPIGFRVMTYRVVYDLWDELYMVRIDGSPRRINRKASSRAEALKLITEIEGFSLVRLADIPKGVHHRLEMVIELNPVSGEALAEMRRWLTRGAGASSLDRSTSFFGSFVSVFVNPKIADADRVVRIRSQPFYRPRAKP